MPEQLHEFRWIVRTARVTLIGVLALLAVGLIAAIAVLVTLLLSGWEGENLTLYLLVLAIPVLLVYGAFAFLAYGLVRLMVTGHAALHRTAGRVGRIESISQEQHERLRELADLASLSEQAKSFVYREKEIEAIREIIRADVIRQDYETAKQLIDQLESRLGYVEEADRLREEVEASRSASLSEKIDKAVSMVQDSIVNRDWDKAFREAQRIRKIFPDNPKVASLGQRIETARATHKRELLQRYGEAVRKNDIDGGIELLKELDRYLTPQEAAALEESARGVFKAKLHNLGVQFAIFVTEQQWDKAIETGEEIIDEFPNTRMAHEVREKMDQLRARASAGVAGS
jgi:tetratricopeptide (TPR) repeat protein